MTTTSASAVTTTTRVSTRTLLAAGLVAGPLYTAVWLGQAATREGFDITRHPASLLANGGPGWIQTANFVIAGILSIAAAVGVRRSITGVLFFGAFAGLMAGAGKPVTITGFGLAIILGWTWIAAISADHRRTN